MCTGEIVRRSWSRVSLIVAVLLFCTSSAVGADPMAPEEIRALIGGFKQDERGPYKSIRWFCPDGTVLPPDKRCAQPGGIQHALYKDVVEKLAREQGVHLGQILAGTAFEAFLDAGRAGS